MKMTNPDVCIIHNRPPHKRAKSYYEEHYVDLYVSPPVGSQSSDSSWHRYWIDTGPDNDRRKRRAAQRESLRRDRFDEQLEHFR